MTNKQIFGVVLLGASVGALFFIYNGFLKPRLEVDAEFKKGDTLTTLTTK